MTADLLRDELLSLPGVESAVIEGDAFTPEGVRVRLSAGVDADAVGEAVQRILAAHGLRSEMAAAGGPVTVEVAPPGSPRPDPASRTEETLATVSVVEGRGGITVHVETSAGRTAERPAPANGKRLDEAVIAAVSELAGVSPTPIVLSIDERDVEGTPVVTVVVEDGRDRCAGSSVVEGGRPYAIGRATWMAMKS